MLSQHLAVSVAANGEVKVLIRPLTVEQPDGLRLQEPSDSDTSSESDTEEITDIREMREIISRMDNDDDGDHDKYDFGVHHFASECVLPVCCALLYVISWSCWESSAAVPPPC